MGMVNAAQKSSPRAKWLWIMAGTVFLLIIMLAADMLWVRVWRNIPIGYNTTRLTGPLRSDGLVNYAAALDSQYGRGITPKNNAVPLLIEATGALSTDREPIFQAYRKQLFARLQIKTPVMKSGFHSYFQWVNLKLGNALTNAQWNTEITRVDPSFRLHPWTAKEFPLAAQWVRANAVALKYLHDAVTRPRYYFPFIRFRYINASSEYLENFRAIVNAAAARAMFRLGNADTNGAVSDIDADMRLATLMSQSPSLIARLIANNVDTMVLQTQAAADGSGQLSRNQLETLLHHTLPRTAILPLTQQLNFQRFDSLAFLERASRHGIRTLISEFNYAHPNGPPSPPALSAQIMDTIIPMNFAETMRQKNRLYDQLEQMMMYHPYLRRQTAVNSLCQYLISSTSQHPMRQWCNPVTAQQSELAKSIRMFFAVFPENMIMQRTITILAVELAIYKCDHGHYPQRLSALAPKYVHSIPLDGFNGQPLKYQLLNDGQSFLLYSVGPNGVDNGGKSTGVGNDDISVHGGPPVLK